MTLTDISFFKDQETARMISSVEDGEFEPSIKILEKALRLAERSGDLTCQAYAKVRLARYYFNASYIVQALDWVNRALILEPKLPRLSPVRQYVIKEIAGIYVDFGAYRMSAPYFREVLRISEVRDTLPNARVYRYCSDYAIFGLQKSGKVDSAFIYYRKAIYFARKIKKYFWESAAYNNYGMALAEFGNKDSALYMYTKALQKLEMRDRHDSLFACSIRDNLGQLYETEERWDEALNLFTQNYICFSKYRNDVQRHINAAVRSAKMLLFLNRIPEAKERSAAVDVLVRACDYENFQKTFAIVNDFKIRLAKETGNWREVANLMGKRIRYNDSLAKIELTTKPIILENIILKTNADFQKSIELSGLREKEANEDARATRLAIYLVTLIGVLVIVAIYVIYRRNSFKNKAKLVEEEYRRELAEVKFRNEVLTKEKLNNELDQKKRDLTDYALALSQKKKILDEVISSLARIKKSGNPAGEVQDLIVVLKSQLKGNANLSMNPGDIEHVNAEFFDKLKNHCPDLSVTERDLCGLLRLKFSPKEISALRNIAPASVRISKFRIKKKLQLNAETDLTDFLSRL
ncbi:MAG TPA: tetratricopeptide repeat protein [Flavobacteriales bacterium]|nr:tetratricopeptide repeat protein [Flavobacteriales bacterium]